MTKILNFGSLNLDYVYQVEHFVRPGETITSLARNVNCGGKGLNQSIALSKAGANVYHAGKIGSDGKMLEDFLDSQNVNTDFVFTGEGASGHAVIEVDSSGQNSIILYPGTNSQIDSAMIDKVLEGFSEGDYLVLQNEINNIPEIMEKAHRKGMFIVINPSPITHELLSYPLHYVSLLIVNEIEGEMLSGEKTPSGMLAALRKKYDANILLTLGASGAMYSGGGKVIKYGIHKAPVVDTTAAGDTMLGFFTGLLSQGYKPADAPSIATKASSITVSGKGAAASIPTLAAALECPYEYVEFSGGEGNKDDKDDKKDENFKEGSSKKGKSRKGGK